MEDTKNVVLKTVPKIRKEQVPSADEASKEILYGDGDRDEDNNK
ncbi:MAG TPA: hypothetical protein VI278_09810 [Nitrososphaeraceae archaeon]|jgi:hypothetical protein